MKLINRENGEELVEVGSHKDYASKGVAGAAWVSAGAVFFLPMPSIKSKRPIVFLRNCYSRYLKQKYSIFKPKILPT